MKKLIAIMFALVLSSHSAFAAYQSTALLLIDVDQDSDMSHYPKKFVYFELEGHRGSVCGGGSRWDPCPLGQYSVVGNQEFHFKVIESNYHFPIDSSCTINTTIPEGGRKFMKILASQNKISCRLL